MSAETATQRTSVDVRAEFESLLERDLLGPWDGPEEELPPKTLPARASAAIELDRAYADIVRARITHWSRGASSTRPGPT